MTSIPSLKTASALLVIAFSLQDARAPKPRAKTHPCIFDLDRGEVPDCLREGTDGGLCVTPQVRKQLNYDADGLAAIYTQKQNWMYVDRKGWIIIRGVPTFDNGPDAFHDGLVRFVRDGKYGYADRKGKVQIAAVYDGAMPFDGGRARVCIGCTVSSDGEHSAFVDGHWMLIDPKGVATTIEAPK